MRGCFEYCWLGRNSMMGISASQFVRTRGCFPAIMFINCRPPPFIQNGAKLYLLSFCLNHSIKLNVKSSREFGRIEQDNCFIFVFSWYRPSVASHFCIMRGFANDVLEEWPLRPARGTSDQQWCCHHDLLYMFNRTIVCILSLCELQTCFHLSKMVECRFRPLGPKMMPPYCWAKAVSYTCSIDIYPRYWTIWELQACF